MSVRATRQIREALPSATERLPVLNVHDLYASHVDRVFSFFAYRVSNVADAEDLTSQTFEKVVRNAARYDKRRAGTSTWVFSIAENVLIDHYRRNGRRNERDFDEAVDQWHASEDRPSIGLTPELQDAVGSLSDRERQVIGLRYGADLRGADIADLVGTTEANVHQIISRALRRMRASIDAHGEVTNRARQAGSRQ